MITARHMFIDAATRYTGWAMFDSDTWRVTGGVVRGSGADVWTRCSVIATELSTLAAKHNVVDAICEFPSFQGGSRGMAAARNGDTLMLAYLCGMIDRAMGSVPVGFVTFQQWNGQRTKEMTCRRFMETFGIMVDPKSIQNNMVDAVMMGVQHLGQRGWLWNKS